MFSSWQVPSPLANLPRWQQVLFAMVLLIGSLFIVTTLGVDFDIYYQAAVEVMQPDGQPYFPYDIGTSFIYHPFILLLMIPFTLLPYWVAFVLWTLLGLVALLGSLQILQKQQWQSWWLLLLVWLPMVEGLINGQINFFILFALVLAYRWHQQKRDGWAGVALACAIVIKLTPIILLAYFFAIRRWRIVVAALIMLLGMTLLGGLVFGMDIVTGFVGVLQASSGQPEVGINNASPYVFIARWLPEATHAALLDGYTVVVGAILVTVTGIAFRAPRRTAPTLFNLFVALSVIVPPIVWIHHLVLLLIPTWYISQRTESLRFLRGSLLLTSLHRPWQFIGLLLTISGAPALVWLGETVFYPLLSVLIMVWFGWMLWVLGRLLWQDWAATPVDSAAASGV